MMLENELWGFNITEDTTEIEVPLGCVAFYVALDALFPVNLENTEVLTASHDHPGFVRQAIITQSERLLAIILYPEDEVWGPEDAEFVLSGVANGTEVTITFSIL